MEEPSSRSAGLEALGGLVAEAHREVLERFQRLAGISLDPVGDTDANPWNYPAALHTSVLQGYLGELLAAFVAETYNPHDHEWRVPAVLFRGHTAAYQELERRRQLGGPARPVPGRTGDDALAFDVDDEGSIIAWLWAEAKCTHNHDTHLIAAGHAQMSATYYAPVDLAELIGILEGSTREDAAEWIASLRELMFTPEHPPRYDMFVYVCGQHPKSRPTWMGKTRPHARYEGAGPLEAVEVRLDDFDSVLRSAYPGHVVHRG